jgi:hypothetical protein
MGRVEKCNLPVERYENEPVPGVLCRVVVLLVNPGPVQLSKGAPALSAREKRIGVSEPCAVV